ncbi:MAG: MFS transporter [Spirochaetes bacterium]|nr:MFS transporter [Spirochaetota bacterium]
MNQKDKRFFKIAIPVWIGSAVSILGDSTIYAVLPLYVGVLGISLTNAGVLMGINRMVRLISNSVCGYFFDFGSRKKIFVGALFLGAFSNLMFGFCSGFLPLFIARILWGIAWSGIIIGGTSILLDETTPETRGKWTGMHYFWLSLGVVLGFAMGGFLSDKIGFQQAMVVNGFISLAGAFFALIFLPNVEVHKKEKMSFANFKKSLIYKVDSKLVFFASIYGISRLIFSGFIVASLLSVITREKISIFVVGIGLATLTGLIGGIRMIVEMCITPFVGYFSDKFKNRLHAVVIILLLGVAGLFFITLAPPYMTLLGLLLCTVPGGGITVLVRTLVADYTADKENQGRSLGFVLTVGDLASAIGPMFAFQLLNFMGLDTIYRVLSLILILYVIVVMVYVRRERKSRTETESGER